MGPPYVGLVAVKRLRFVELCTNKSPNSATYTFRGDMVVQRCRIFREGNEIVMGGSNFRFGRTMNLWQFT